jgi:hypothetical protein
MTKHLKIEKTIKVSNGKKSLSRENLIYKHDKVNDAIGDFYGWLKETNTSTKWFDKFLETYGDLIQGFDVPTDLVIHKGQDLRFYTFLNIYERPDVIFDLCIKANVPEEWGMLFGTPNQILGVGIICNIGAKEEDVVLDYKVYRVVDINDYNNQIWWNSTPLKTFSWPEGMRHMIIDFDNNGIGVMIPGGRGLPEEAEIPSSLLEFLEVLKLEENPRNIRWITVYLKDLQELITNKKPITSYNYYLREEE